MNLQSLIVVVLRLMALNFLLNVAIQLTPQLLHYLRLFEPSDYGDPPTVWPFLILGFMLIGAVIMWVLAVTVARFVTRGVPQEISFGQMSLADCYTIAFVGIGAFYVVGNFSSVLNWSLFMFREAASTYGDAWKEQVDFYGVSEIYVSFIIGVALVLKGRSLALKMAERTMLSQTDEREDNQTLPSSE